MNILLGPDAERLIEAKLKTGKYASAEDVVLAGLQSLASQGEAEFAPGELDRLLAEGEESIAAEGTLDGAEAFKARRARRGQ